MIKKIFLVALLFVGFVYAGKGGSITTGRDKRVLLVRNANAQLEEVPAPGQNLVEFAAYGDVDHTNKVDCLQLGTIVAVAAAGFYAFLQSQRIGQ